VIFAKDKVEATALAAPDVATACFGQIGQERQECGCAASIGFCATGDAELREHLPVMVDISHVRRGAIVGGCRWIRDLFSQSVSCFWDGRVVLTQPIRDRSGATRLVAACGGRRRRLIEVLRLPLPGLLPR
jgi:hypothetical protein